MRNDPRYSRSADRRIRKLLACAEADQDVEAILAAARIERAMEEAHVVLPLSDYDRLEAKARRAVAYKIASVPVVLAALLLGALLRGLIG